MKRNVILSLTLSTAIVAAPHAAMAGNPDRDYVDLQLGMATLIVFTAGAVPVDDGYDRLDAGYYHTWTLTLNRGVSYGVLAACDASCRDLDMALYDEYGNLISSDLTSDDYPTVSVTPRWTGKYTLKVSMVTCHDEPCLYGFGLFRR
ncbi:MAG TPA: hypothetical protein VN493_25240 [Thermoanaerobaculia bacterium]|nr:hypothetical protein [Thermoanaerobaculia bacterium]